MKELKKFLKFVLISQEGWIPAAVAAASALYAGVKGGEASAQAVQSSNKQNASLYWHERTHQQKMSNTAHQRQVKDMIAAGLNPMLSAGMSGSGTPGTSTPTMQAEDPNIQQTIEATANTALQATRLKKEIKAIDASIKKTNAETTNIEGDNPKNEIKKHAFEVLQDTILGQSAKLKQKQAETKQKKYYHKSQASKDRQKFLNKKGKTK